MDENGGWVAENLNGRLATFRNPVYEDPLRLLSDNVVFFEEHASISDTSRLITCVINGFGVALTDADTSKLIEKNQE